jgi:hypothetical protein
MIQSIRTTAHNFSNSGGRVKRVRGRQALILYDSERLPFFTQINDSLDEVGSVGTKYAAHADDPEAIQLLLHFPFALQLASAVNAKWVGRVFFGVRFRFLAIEDVVRADVHQGDVQILANDCQVARPFRIRAKRQLLLRFAAIYIGEGSGIYHHAGLGGFDALAGRGFVRNVCFSVAGASDLMARRKHFSYGAREHSLFAGEKDLHRKF